MKRWEAPRDDSGYRSLTLDLDPRRGTEYAVKVTSPAGDSRNLVDLSGMEGAVRELLQEVDASTYRRDLLASAPDASETATAAEAVSRLGGTLFRALFHDQALSLLDRSLGMTDGLGGLRIVVEISAADPFLNSLPWEFLFREENREFLGRSRLSPVVRRIDAREPHRALPLTEALRILAIPSTPADAPPLDLGGEIASLREAWADCDGVELHVLEEASLEALRESLLERAVHVLHFAGHGEFRDGRGVLFFGSDRPDPVESEFLSHHLKDFKSLRLAVLNACNSAKSVDGSRYDPFGGVATALALSGVPAVVGMQFPISDRAAVRFSRAFYRRLAAGETIDAAVTEGRWAICDAEPASLEWGTPVVFLRDPPARLWRPRATVGGTELSQHWPWNRRQRGSCG